MATPIYFTRPGLKAVGLETICVTQEEFDTKKRFYVPDTDAAFFIRTGGAKPFNAEEIVKAEIEQPLWKHYVTKAGASTVAEKKYLIDICTKLGVKDADLLKRGEIRKLLEEFEKTTPDILQSVIDGKMDLSPQKTQDDVFAEIQNGTDDVLSYEKLLDE